MSQFVAQKAPAAAGGSLDWVRPPQQARSHATLARMLDAAESLLEEKSWEDTTVAEIARRARSSVGAFYARFRDKQGFLRALQDRFLEEALATSDAALDSARWAGVSLEQTVGDLVEFLVRVSRRRESLLRALEIRAATDPESREQASRLTRRIARGLERLVLERCGDAERPTHARGAAFAVRVALGVLTQRLLFGEDSNRYPLGDSELVEELTRVCLSCTGALDPRH